jgi:hypothetical protein
VIINTRTAPAQRSKIWRHTSSPSTSGISLSNTTVITGHRDALTGGRAVVDDVHGQRTLPQPARDGVRQHPVVLHHQHPHDYLPPAAAVNTAEHEQNIKKPPNGRPL